MSTFFYGYKFNFTFQIIESITKYKAEYGKQKIIVDILWGEENLLKIRNIFLKDNEIYYTYHSINDNTQYGSPDKYDGLSRVVQTTKVTDTRPISFSIHFNIVDRRPGLFIIYTKKWITGEVKCKTAENTEFITHYKFDDNILLIKDGARDFKTKYEIQGGKSKTKRRRRNKKRHNKTAKRRRRV